MSHPLSLLFLSLISVSLAAPSSVFAPYIAASQQRRLSLHISAASASASVAHHRVATAPPEPHLSEHDARNLMVARPPAAPNPRGKKSNPKPYAQGHTFIPSVNLNSPSHPVPKPAPPRPAHHAASQGNTNPAADKPRLTSAAHNAQPADARPIVNTQPAVQTETGPAEAPHELALAPTATRADEHREPVVPARVSTAQPSASAPVSQPSGSARRARALTPGLLSLDAAAVRVPESLFGNSTVVPLVAVAAVVWLTVMVVRGYGACAWGSQRRARLIRKRFAAPKDIRV